MTNKDLETLSSKVKRAQELQTKITTLNRILKDFKESSVFNVEFTNGNGTKGDICAGYIIDKTSMKQHIIHGIDNTLKNLESEFKAME